MPGIKYPMLSVKPLFPAKEKPRNHPPHGKNPTYQGIIWGLRSLKNPTVLWLNTPMWKSTFQRFCSHTWENRFLSSYSTIMIWRFKIVLYFVSSIYHVPCALNPQLKFLDATYVQITSQGSDYNSVSPSLSLICFPHSSSLLLSSLPLIPSQDLLHSESKKPEAPQSMLICL